MSRTIEGTYHGGKIDLPEVPEGIEHARVLVTFLDEQPSVESTAGSEAVLTKVDDVPQSGPERDALVEEILAEMEEGFDLGGRPYPTREEIYNERLDELDRRRRSHH